MKKIRRIYRSPWVIAALCFLFVLVSCEREEDANPEPQTVEFTGKELFKGVFFTEGKIGKQIDLYSERALLMENLSQEDRSQASEQTNKVVDYIDRAHPGFFQEFKAALHSKNHNAIKDMLLVGTNHLSEAMPEVFPAINELRNTIQNDVDKGVIAEDGKLIQEKLDAKLPEYETLLADNMISSGDQRATTLIFNINIWININVHTNVNVQLNVNLHTNVNIDVNINITEPDIVDVFHDGTGNPDSLYFEMLVDDIAQLQLTH